MMNLTRLTADGLIKAAIQRSKIDDSDPDVLLQKVIADMDGEATRMGVNVLGSLILGVHDSRVRSWLGK